MQSKSTLFAFFFVLTINASHAQVPKDATVPLMATVSLNPASVTLNWPNLVAANLLVQRRTKGQAGNQWIQLLSVTNSTQSSLADNNVAVGQTYEYRIQRTTNINAHGYAHVAMQAPETDSQGKVLLFLDTDIFALLAPEIERLRNDLVGDGWQIIEHVTNAASTTQTVKDQIVADYNADPANVKSVFLLGKIPVPYSGNSAWDGHGDHQGAWPSDAWYADMNGAWTDASVNNTTPTRAANDNVPGDGKFDQSFIPSEVELQVGRVDFRRLTQGTFGATTAELLKRYLDKNHNWRIGVYTVDNKALVDDNFGYFGGEAFAANGFRNAYPLVGEGNVSEADFFNNTNPQSYLLGYGTGGGSYTSAGGVGNSANFATDTVNIVFSNLFGSYHGDWDFETNPFMPSALASRGGILTCAWAGRPHHFYQALASGETIGYCMKETQNAQYNTGFFPTFGESGAHVALLGDPTLRAHIVTPPTDVAAVLGCGKVELNWAASSDTAVSGYHVYRSFSKNGAYTRLTSNTISGTTFVDNSPVTDTLHYQIRALKLQTSPGGGIYWNNSTGAMLSIVYAPPAPPQLSISNSEILTCINEEVPLSAVSNPAGISYQWAGPNNFSASTQNVTAESPGIYSVTVTFANGCTNSANTTVLQDLAAPPFGVVVGGPLTCLNPNTTIELILPPGVCACSISGPGGFFTPTHVATVTLPGIYTLKTVYCATGCTNSATITVTQNIAPPEFLIGPISQLDCNIACVIIQPVASTPPGLNLPQVVICEPGIYTYSATNPANGCTASQTYEVKEAPPLLANETVTVGCNGIAQIAAGASGGTPPYQYLWPNGDTTSIIILPVGFTYVFTVTDAGGCIFESIEVTIAGPNALSVSLTSTNESAPGAKDGTATATVSGGTGNFTYLWSDGQTSQTATGLSGGTYTVNVTDTETGCTLVETVVVETTVGTDEAGLFKELQLSPNPTGGLTFLSFKLQKTALVQVAVRDMAGRLVWEKPETVLSEAQVSIDLSKQAAGVYTVFVSVEKQMVVRKLAVVR